jgi:predicted N-acyltransferase
VANHSLHRFFDPRLQAVMAAHIDRINEAEQEGIEELNRAVPLAEGRGAG